jgi:hypothetical protein
MESFDKHVVWENYLVTNKEYLPVSWVVEGLIPAQAITLLTGWRGSFKTYLSLGIGEAISTGRAFFLGRGAKCMPVFYLNRDNPQPVFTSRLRQFCLLDERNENFAHWSLWHRFGPPRKLETPGFEYYMDLAERYQPLMIFDSLQRFHSGDENSAKDMAAVFEKFRELTTLGGTLLVLHNSGRVGA